MNGVSFWSLFLASLIGSPHCAGMCGGFAGYISNANWGNSGTRPRPGINLIPQLSYHLSRIATYVLLGAMAGAFGEVVEQTGGLLGIRRLAPLLVGVVLILHAGLLFFDGEGKLTRIFAPFTHRFASTLNRLSQSGRWLGPSLLGVLTAFLPCGWLYSFVVLAVAAGNAYTGALSLLVFGLGTLPILLGLGTVLRKTLITARIAPARITALLVFAAGFLSLGQHLGFLPHWMPTAPPGAESGSDSCPEHH